MALKLLRISEIISNEQHHPLLESIRQSIFLQRNVFEIHPPESHSINVDGEVYEIEFDQVVIAQPIIGQQSTKENYGLYFREKALYETKKTLYTNGLPGRYNYKFSYQFHPATGLVKSSEDPDVIKAERNTRYTKSFVREAAIATMITGTPHIAVEATPNNKTARMITKYVHGISLDEFINQNPNLNSYHLAILFYAAMRAVNYVHDKKFVHRDVKPGNILINKFGEQISAKMIDFGLAHKIGESFHVKSTLYYASPEVKALYLKSLKQILTREEVRSVDTQTDLYSLGLVLLNIFNVSYDSFDAFIANELTIADLVNEIKEINIDISASLLELIEYTLTTLLNYNPNARGNLNLHLANWEKNLGIKRSETPFVDFEVIELTNVSRANVPVGNTQATFALPPTDENLESASDANHAHNIDETEVVDEDWIPTFMGPIKVNDTPWVTNEEQCDKELEEWPNNNLDDFLLDRSASSYHNPFASYLDAIDDEFTGDYNQFLTMYVQSAQVSADSSKRKRARDDENSLFVLHDPTETKKRTMICNSVLLLSDKQEDDAELENINPNTSLLQRAMTPEVNHSASFKQQMRFWQGLESQQPMNSISAGAVTPTKNDKYSSHQTRLGQPPVTPKGNRYSPSQVAYVKPPVTPSRTNFGLLPPVSPRNIVPLSPCGVEARFSEQASPFTPGRRNRVS